MQDSETSDELSAEYALTQIQLALDGLQMPFGIYDANDRLIACSGEIFKLLEGIIPDTANGLLDARVEVKDMLTAFFESRFPPETAAIHVEAEMHRHNSRKSSVRDVNNDGIWLRRIHSVADDGQTIIMTTPIDELVRKSTALSEAKEQLEHLANHDPLTGLPNRRGLSDHLAELSRIPEADAYNVAVLHVDLDKFKLVNDTLGHDAGDSVLSRAAKILRAQVRDTDVVARVGGDEFVIVCHRIPDEQSITGCAQRIVEQMAVPMDYGEQKCQIGASIGIAITSAHNISEHVLMDADIALYEAKNKGRGRYEFFYPVFRNRYSKMQRQINEVRDGIHLNAFEPFFQPQICSETHDVVGFEAVARWRDREKGILEPEEFMPALAEARLMESLDEMMLRKTIQAIRAWEAEGMDVPQVTVKISQDRLRSENCVSFVKWLVDGEGLDAGRLGFEFDENAVAGEASVLVAQNIQKLSDAGFSISLDNFGSGHTSIAGLRKLAIDTIKIEDSFVVDVENDTELQTITGAMISLIRNLKMRALCNGVDTQSQASMLHSLGAQVFQGAHFSKPYEASFIPIWMEGYEQDRTDIRLTA